MDAPIPKIWDSPPTLDHFHPYYTMPLDFVKPLMISIFYLIFAILAWRRLPWAVLFVIATLSSYLIRFRVGPIPMTLLEGMILIVVAIWLLRRIFNFQFSIFNQTPMSKIPKLIIDHWSLVIPIILFLLAATLSLFVAPDLRAAAGIWKAYFVEPILFFLVLKDLLSSKSSTKRTSPNSQFPIFNDQSNSNVQNQKIDHWSLGLGISANQIITALAMTALVLSLYTIMQRFTGFGIPPPWNKELRVTSIFPYPNALALFLGPLVPLFVQSLALVLRRGQKLSFYQVVNIGYWLLATILSLTAIIFAKSTGAIVGITAGLIVMGLLVLRGKAHDREKSHALKFFILHSLFLILTFAVLAAFTVLAPTSVKNELLLRNWSGHVRRTQWSETITMLKDRPIFGAGLAGYKETLAPYHKATYLEIFEYPHNIVLNFWSETGLLGLLAFAWLIIIFFRQTFKSLGIRNWALGIPAMASMLVMLVHGLVDVPYFKNDLAVLFWIVFALGLTRGQKNEMMQS